MKPAYAHIAMAIYALVCIAAITWPGYPYFADRTRPMILGLPFVFAWNIAWVLLSFIVIALYDRVLERCRRSGS